MLLDDYHYRMNNVFDSGTNKELSVPPLPSIRFPRRRELLQPTPAININLLEFLRLSSCDLQRLLGQRNSSLGNVMPSSQRFLYELSFLELAQTCIASLQPKSAAADLVDTLTAAVVEKQKHLDAYYWNATWGSEEFQKLFSTAAPLPGLSFLQRQPAALEASLEALLAGSEHWRQQLLEEREAAFEQALAVVGSDRYLGQMRLSMWHARHVLAQVKVIVEEAQNTRAICLQGRVTPAGRIMERVFYRYYIGQVQPVLSLTSQRVDRLRSQLQGSLSRGPAVVTEGYWRQVWDDAPESEWGQFRQAIAGHTRMWQGLLKHCGLRPGVRPAGLALADPV
ncbi:DUF3080 family protein [Pseudomaricurvus hydrocarbonicus]